MLAICARLPTWSSEKAALGAFQRQPRVMRDESVANKRLSTNSRKSSQRAFANSRFWWLLTPFFMTRQNQKRVSPERLLELANFCGAKFVSYENSWTLG